MTASLRIVHFRLGVRPHKFPFRHLSSSSDDDDDPQPLFSSHFSDVKASLQKEPPPHNRSHPSRRSLNAPSQMPPPPKLTFSEDIRLNISKFRKPSPSSPPSSRSGQYVSLQELYKRNVIVIDNPDSSSTSSNFPRDPSFDAIREGIRQFRINEFDSRGKNDAVSLARFSESLKVKPNSGSENDKVGSTATMITECLKMYDYAELGSKLKMLGPEKKKGKWFSLQELNERLARLRVLEEKESQVRMGGISFKDLREALISSSLSENDKKMKKRMQRLNILNQLGATPSYMMSPPKDELVEKYFDPENMSAAEKLKLELRKVREEFKMSESDCGSARVQVAQLTTKIKYLSTVLRKKDKHSRKGLQEMVQRRKKLLKYLRRTDWDSYCLVISKFGLRDTSDIKIKP